MQVSVVIPTYNRTKDLEECLDSILIQTILPKEVIVVDNGNDIETKNLVRKKKEKFKEKDIDLRYIKNEVENALTVAKNLGVKNSTGAVLSFLDDDVILDRQYYKNLIKIFEMYPSALGVCGYPYPLSGKKKDLFRKKIFENFLQLFGRLFYLGFNEKNKFHLLSSLDVIFPPLDNPNNIVTNCEWISGASTFKREVFDEFQYDENLKKYSQGEDQDFSHRIFKKYSHSLFCNLNAKYIHKLSSLGRMQKKEKTYMDEIYYLYLFYKIIDQTSKNKLIYLWSRMGKIILKMIFLVLKPSKSKLTEIKYLIDAYIYCIKHIKEIKEGDLEFFNKELR